MTREPSRSPEDALRAWPLDGPLRPADDGLINRTYLVGRPPQAVLQWVNPIFDPSVQRDIHRLTERLHEKGLATPRLVPTRDDELLLPDETGFWRVLTYVPGTTVHRLQTARQARSAGALLGRFHGALADWQVDLDAPRRDVHRTEEHMATLRLALDTCDGHPLAEPAREVGRALLDAWASWEGTLDLPERICHGDPKISNLRFADDGETGVCLIDLDTVGPQTLAAEMGDAWRSWCNPAGEDDPAACDLDLELFGASARAWRAEVGDLDPEELRSLVPGVERICLELAARFCADAVRNSYFREDRERFPEPGSHNLQKARCQQALAAKARDRRSECERIVRGDAS